MTKKIGRPSIKPAIIAFLKANPDSSVDDIMKGAIGRVVSHKTIHSHLVALRTQYKIETRYRIIEDEH